MENKEKKFTISSEYPNCFVKEEKNPRGLRVKFHQEGEKAKASVMLDATLEGYQGVVHGGILSSLLDEALIYAGYFAIGQFTVTGELKVRFLKPTPTGGPYSVEGKIKERKGRILLGESQITNDGGIVFAKAEGKLFVIESPSFIRSVKKGKDQPRLAQNF